MFFELLSDGLFAALASVGFAAISHLPRRAYPFCALLAALGHSVRFALMHYPAAPLSITLASAVAALIIGFTAVLLTPFFRIPAETCFFPALLPMIPGMYAYRTVEALILCLHASGDEVLFNHHLYLLMFNGLTCTFTILSMGVGAIVPTLLLRGMAFRATRRA